METDPRPSIVVVDDAAEVRTLLRTRLRLSDQLRLVGEGSNGRQAVDLAREHQPVLMLLDVSMPGMDGLEALPAVLEASPRTRVALYSGFEEQGLADRALQLGAAAFIEKSTPVDALEDQLRALAAGGAPRTVPTPRVGTARPAEDRGVLDEHLERFREVFEEAAIGMATMTLSGHLVRTNRAMAELEQRPSARMIGLYYGDLTGGAEQSFQSALQAVVQDGQDVAQFAHHLTGALDGRRVRATLAPIRDSAGRPLYLFLQVQDVTAEEAATEGLRRSEERFRLLVEAVEDYAIFMLDPSGYVVSWNSGAQRSKGYTAEEIIGQHFRVFYPPEVAAARHPEHELEIALREGHYEEEGWRLRRDGTRFWANVLITAVFNAAGEHVGFAKVTRDTTERRILAQERERAAASLAAANDELARLNARLEQSAEQQAQFLAVTAHELRTPVSALGGAADLLAGHWEQLTDEERAELLLTLSSGTSRLRRLLDDLLTASRLQASALQIRPQPTQLQELASQAAIVVQRTEPGAEIQVEIPGDLQVLADADRLAQALENLLTNALRHGAAPVRVIGTLAGQSVEIRVVDHGSGVPENLRERLFERFVTGGYREGTGLGLFIVRELARVHGGEASYEPPSAGFPSGAFLMTIPTSSAREP
ncbi:MAG TPA: PAS domain S-box protein [Oryzihumus sp.]|nr:PAS domain S-box protein [Oryzihumus sp.]